MFSVGDYAWIEKEDSVILFGGYVGTFNHATVAKFDGQWSDIGKLNIPRRGHAAVEYDGTTFIFGGLQDANSTYAYILRVQ